MPKAKKFDIVQILGISAAVLLLIGGNYYLSAKHARERAEWEARNEKAQAEWQRLHPVTQPEIANSGSPGVEQKKTAEEQPKTDKKPAPPPPPAEAEAADAGDITVPAARLALVFTAKGAAIRKADLTQEYIDPGHKGKGKGLELLAEIEAGKLAFGMPRFEIGPPEPERKQERLVFDAANGPLKALSHRTWKLESNSKGFDAEGRWTIRYSAALAQKFAVSKTFTIHRDREYVELGVGVSNQSDAAVTFSYSLYGAPGVLLDGPPENPKGGAYVSIVAALAGRETPAPGQPAPSPDVLPVWPDTAAKEQSDKNSLSKAQNIWGGIKNRFFMAMLISLDPEQLIRISAVPIASNPNSSDKRLAEPNAGILGLRRDSSVLEPDKSSAGDRYALYLGPGSENSFAEAESQLNLGQPLHLAYSLQYFDMASTTWPRVDWFARQMLTVFRFLSRVFGNYGIAVILLTLLIKVCLHPLQRKMMVSMNKMQKLQPELKKLQDKYKGQTNTQAKQRMFQEQQDIMRKGGASYSAGCLPMFVQLPILTALYGVVNRAFDIRGAEFLWIKDLSQADRLATFPFFPHELNLLPIVYAVLQLLQMKISPQPKPTDPQQEMQQKMMAYMPLVFSVMLYSMASGLMLYFAASAIFGMLESWYIRKFLIKDGAPVPAPAVAKKQVVGGR